MWENQLDEARLDIQVERDLRVTVTPAKPVVGPGESGRAGRHDGRPARAPGLRRAVDRDGRPVAPATLQRPAPRDRLVLLQPDPHRGLRDPGDQHLPLPAEHDRRSPGRGRRCRAEPGNGGECGRPDQDPGPGPASHLRLFATGTGPGETRGRGSRDRTSLSSSGRRAADSASFRRTWIAVPRGCRGAAPMERGAAAGEDKRSTFAAINPADSLFPVPPADVALSPTPPHAETSALIAPTFANNYEPAPAKYGDTRKRNVGQGCQSPRSR